MDYGMDHIHSHLFKKREKVATCLGLLNNANNNKLIFQNHFDIIQSKLLELTERKYW